jgi:hypothetical protein
MTIKPGCYRDVYDLSATPHVAHACAAGTEAPSNGHRVAWTIERPTCAAALRKSTSVNVRHRRPTHGFRPRSHNSFHLSDQPGNVRDTAAFAKAVDDAGTGLGVTGDRAGRRQHLGGLMTLAAGVLAASWTGSWVVAGPKVSNRIWWTLLSMCISDPEWLGGSTGHGGVSAEPRSAGSFPAGGRISAFAT